VASRDSLKIDDCDVPATPGELHLSLLGGFGLSCNGQAVSLSEAARRLLAALCLKEHSVPRWHLAGLLWPDRSEQRAQANLRSALYRLPTAARHATVESRSGIELATWVTRDTDQLRRSARALIARDAAALADLDVGLLEPAGDLLPGWSDDWVVVERERLRQLKLHALEALSCHLTEMGRVAEAIDAALAAIEMEPLRESAHRCAIRAHLAEGNTSEARRSYSRYRATLRTELGLGPSRELTELIEGAVGATRLDTR
jgi:DNA-binding SARP family transcriptional activator